MGDPAPLFLSLRALSGKKVTAAFDGSRIASDGGVMLLAEAERKLAIADRLAELVPDLRDPRRVGHLLGDIPRAGILAPGREELAPAPDPLRDELCRQQLGWPQAPNHRPHQRHDAGYGHPCRRHVADRQHARADLGVQLLHANISREPHQTPQDPAQKRPHVPSFGTGQSGQADLAYRRMLLALVRTPGHCADTPLAPSRNIGRDIPINRHAT